MASAIKFIRSTTREDLESAINTFLEGKTVVSVGYSYDGYAHQAVVAYTETDATTEEDTTPTTGDTTPTTGETPEDNEGGNDNGGTEPETTPDTEG